MTKISGSPAPYGTPGKPGKPGISLDFASNVGSVIDLPPEAIAKAVRAVTGRSVDAADARFLLDALGLLPTPDLTETTP